MEDDFVKDEEMNNYENLCFVEKCSLHYHDFEII